ncbi:MAG TPA: NAD(P)/FAD-dependent oxidoreductase, partial [Acidimicrobiia bacterium]|nr:NAD(P)/FAD-dependent oxidoreductase [Acidimicrobiia bacterium]
MPGDRVHDVVVIGGGCAGVTCALECFDIQLDTLLVESAGVLGGQLPEILHSIRNLPAGTYRSGRDLQRALHTSAAILGDRARLTAPVGSVDLDGRRLTLGDHHVSYRALVVATGTRLRQLAAAPDRAFGGDVTYQLEEDPGHFTGSVAAVIGGGDSGVLDALALAADSATVTLIHRSPTLSARDDLLADLRAETRVVDLPGWDLDAIHGTDGLQSIDLVRPDTGERRNLNVARLVVKAGREPNTAFLAGQLELDRAGAINVDAD